MMMFLQIIGGIVIAIILIIALFYAWVRLKFGKMLDYADADNEPLQLHLNEDHAPGWRDKGEAGRLFAELKRCGFEPGRAYTVVELDSVKVQSLFNPPYIATLYEHPMVKSWVDLSFDAEGEDLEIDVTNAEIGETIKTRPESSKIYLKDARVPALLERLKQEAGDRTGKLVNDASYREHFEEAYRKDMVWRCSRGGMTYDEFEATAKASDVKFKEANVKQAFIDTKVQELHRWHEAAIERIHELDKNFMETVYEKGKDVFVLPKEGNVEAFIRYMSEAGVVDDDQADSMIEAFSSQSDLQMVAKRIFDGISNDLRPKKLRDIDFPVAGEIYEISF